MRVAAVTAGVAIATAAYLGGVGAEIAHVANQATAPIRAEIASARLIRAETNLSGAASAVQTSLAGTGGAPDAPSLSAAITESDPAARVVAGAPAPSGWISAGEVGNLWTILATAAGPRRCVAVRINDTTWTLRWTLLRAGHAGSCYAGAPLLHPLPPTANPLTAGWSPAPPSTGARS